MTNKIIPLTVRDVSYVAQNMRGKDLKEIGALMKVDDPSIWAWQLMQAGPIGKVVTVPTAFGDVPCWVVGAVEKTPNVFEVFAFATDNWKRGIGAVTHYIREHLIPDLYDRGAIRADCLSIEDHHQAHRWLKMLGACIENEDSSTGGLIENRGKAGENYYCFVWTRLLVEKSLHQK